MIRALLACLALGLVCGCNAALVLDEAPTGGVQELTVGRFITSEAATPPPPGEPGWVPIELPEDWGHRQRWSRCGFYHLPVPGAPPREVAGIYLFRLHLNAAVFFNGAFLGDGGRMAEPTARNWNRPLYFTIPPPLWRPAGNEVVVRLCSSAGAGLLGAVQLGPERVLRPRYELRHFLQVEVSAVLCLVLVGLSLFLFSLYLRRRSDAVYLWLGGACLLWAAFSAYLFIRDPRGIPGLALQWLAHACIDWWVFVLVGFVHRFVGVARPRLERLLVASNALGMVVTAIAPPVLARGVSFRVFHAVSLGALLYTAAYVLRAFARRRTPELSLLVATVGFLALSGLHDWAGYALFSVLSRSMLGSVLGHAFITLPYAVPLVFSTLAWHLSRRFTDALDEAERLNAELEERVERGRRKLEQSFAERRGLEREQAAADARERVYRDLHDDIGAKLLSLVIGAEDPRQADVARAALQDLRDIVSHSARGQAPLQDLLGDWRAEIAQRAAAAGLALDWEQAAELPDVAPRPDAALNLGRVLREAVSNVLRHAQARRLAVRVAARDGRLLLEIEDDGVGVDFTRRRQGRGVCNMRARAVQLGAAIDWQAAAPRGCRVALRVPLSRLGPEAEDPT